MGLDFDVFKKLIEQATNHGQQIGYTTPPATVQFDCVIMDLTQQAQRYIRVKNPLDASKPLLDELTLDQVCDGLHQRWGAMLVSHPNMHHLANLIVLMDSPQHVPAAKIVEHQKRDYEAYSLKDLKDFCIVLNDGAVECNFEPNFGTKMIWGDRLRLWATRPTRERIGSFFGAAALKVLAHQIPADRVPFARNGPRPALTAPNHFFVQQAARMNTTCFIIDGAWTDDRLYYGPIGSSVHDSEAWHPCYPTGGEADTKCIAYINADFGKNFLLRSDDGDWPLMVLARLAALEAAGVSELPQVWIDRTTHPKIEANTDNPHRYLNITAMYNYIVHQRKYNLLAVVTLLLLRGSDYSAGFHELVTTKTSGGTKVAPIYGPQKIVGEILTSPTYQQCFGINWLHRSDGMIAELNINTKALTRYLFSRYDALLQTPALNNKLLNTIACLRFAVEYIFNALYHFMHPNSTTQVPFALHCLESNKYGWQVCEPPTNATEWDMLALVIPTSVPWRAHIVPADFPDTQTLFGVTLKT